MGVEVRVLGSLGVVEDDRVTALPGRKHRSLLTALVISGGRPSPPDELVDAIWGEAPPASARKLLQLYVSQLRKALPAGIEIVTSAGGYALELGDASLDAARFERLAAEVGQALDNGNPMLAVALADRALSLWRGPAYADALYDDFARGESERLEELRLATLENRVEAQLRLGRHDAVLPEALALAGEHPLRERLQGQAMLALYRCGRQSEALGHYTVVRDRLRDELGLDPGGALRDLQRRILQQDPELDVRSTEEQQNLLPLPPTPLVGRVRELEQLAELLHDRRARLLVLTGAGGSGKTRLALEAARAAGPSFANGVVLVELAPLRDTALVVPAIARAVGIAEGADATPLETLTRELASRELLLVLDNAEHLREAAPLYPRLLAAAPRLVILVTSRAVLHVRGEHVFPVGPLPPDDALELFVQRATALEPSFARTPENEADVREVCLRTDGLPLAVELAAARIRSLPLRALRDRLGERLAVLTGGPRDLPARQQTLRATLEWSAGLLAEDERDALARLAVFAGTWSLEAAETICALDLDAVTTLVDQSLVRTVADGHEPRYTMLETVREFAAELLDASGRRRVVEEGHAAYFLRFAEAAEEGLAGPEQGVWLDRLEAEHDESRVALARLAAWGTVSDELRLAAALGRYRYVRGYLTEGQRAIERALERGGDVPPAIRAKACRVASALTVLIGDYRRALELAEEGLRLYELAEDTSGVARSLSNIGAILVASGQPERAASVLDEAVRLARTLPGDRALALALNNRGDVALTLGRYDAASEYFAESLELLRRVGDEANVARALFNLGVTALERHEDEASWQSLSESIDRCRDLDDKEDIAWCLVAFAALQERGGDPERAGVLLGAADRLLAGMGATLKPYEQRLHSRTADALARQLTADRLALLGATGGALPIREAVALAHVLPGSAASDVA